VSQSLNIRNVLLWLEGRHGDRRLHHWSMALSIALCSTPAHTSITCCIRIIHILHFCMADSLLNYAPDSVDKWLRSELFGGHKSGSSERWPWSLRLFHFRSGGSKWCTNCLGKHNMQKTITARRILSKLVLQCCNVCNQITSDVWRDQ